MSLRSVLLAVSAGTVLLLSGCAVNPQLPVDLNASAISAPARIGVAMPALPKAEVYMPGADCLLCILAARGMNSSLSTHTESLGQEDLGQLKEKAAEALRKKGATVVVIAEPLDLKALGDAPAGDNLARKNFMPLKAKYNVDKLLVIDITSLGFHRTYASYFPTSDPKGMLSGAGYMVNLGTNAYEWYAPVSIYKSAEGPWDEPPRFPGLTNAYFQAIELGKDGFLKPLAR